MMPVSLLLHFGLYSLNLRHRGQIQIKTRKKANFSSCGSSYWLFAMTYAYSLFKRYYSKPTLGFQ